MTDDQKVQAVFEAFARASYLRDAAPHHTGYCGNNLGKHRAIWLDPRCRTPLPRYICTRPQGHDGPHVAHESGIADRPLCAWR